MMGNSPFLLNEQDAIDVPFDNVDKLLKSTNVQDALEELIPAYVVHVGANRKFTTIQQAVAYVETLTLSNSQWAEITVAPGTYTGTVTLPNYTHLRGSSRDSTILVGRITVASPTTRIRVSHLTVTYTPTADNVPGILSGAGSIEDCRVNVVRTADYSAIGIDLNSTEGAMNLLNFGVVLMDMVSGLTKDIHGIQYSGSAITAVAVTSVRGLVNAVAGTITGYRNVGSGECVINSSGMFVENQAATSTAQVSGHCYCGTGQPAILTDFQVRLTGNGQGTAIAFRSEGAVGSEVQVNNASVFFNGTWTTEYTAFTLNDGASQAIRLVSLNKAVGGGGLGQNLITPYDNVQTGFQAWGSSGNLWSITGSTFSVLRRGIGYIRSVPRKWAAGSVTLIANQINLIKVDAEGVVVVDNSFDEGDFTNNIPLFTCMYDGTRLIVKRENHPYDFPTKVSRYAHRNFGVRIGLAGGDLARVTTGTGAAVTDRYIAVTTLGTIDDHGVEGIIPVNTAGITMQFWYRNASQIWTWVSTSQQVPMQYLLAGVPTAIASNSYGIMRLDAIIDGGDTTAPTYVINAGNAQFNNTGDALTAINAERLEQGQYFQMPDGVYESMEPATFAYLIIRNTAAGGYIERIIRVRQPQ